VELARAIIDVYARIARRRELNDRAPETDEQTREDSRPADATN
jgi:hypothetical protein